jgi:hypothetical protein
MGYGYAWSDNSTRQVRVCDQCGKPGGTRLRKCPRMVLQSGLRSGMRRYKIHYCRPASVCDPCYKAIGGAKVLHADCAAGAARHQAEEDAIAAALEAGERFAVCAYGDWKEDVPDGMAGVAFEGKADIRFYLVDDHDYNAPENYRRRLSDFPGAQLWEGHNGENTPATKQVTLTGVLSA